MNIVTSHVLPKMLCAPRHAYEGNFIYDGHISFSHERCAESFRRVKSYHRLRRARLILAMREFHARLYSFIARFDFDKK